MLQLRSFRPRPPNRRIDPLIGSATAVLCVEVGGERMAGIIGAAAWTIDPPAVLPENRIRKACNQLRAGDRAAIRSLDAHQSPSLIPRAKAACRAISTTGSGARRRKEAMLRCWL